MSYRKIKKNVTRNLTELEKKVIITLKAAVNNQPLRKRIIYALRIIGGSLKRTYGRIWRAALHVLER